MRRMRAMQVTILAALMMRRSLCRMAAQFYHLGVGRSQWTLKNGGKRPFYTNKISRLALTLPIFDRFGKMGYQIDPLVKPDSKHSLLFLEGSILGPFTYLKGTVLKGHYSDQVLWPTRRYYNRSQHHITRYTRYLITTMNDMEFLHIRLLLA